MRQLHLTSKRDDIAVTAIAGLWFDALIAVAAAGGAGNDHRPALLVAAHRQIELTDLWPCRINHHLIDKTGSASTRFHQEILKFKTQRPHSIQLCHAVCRQQIRIVEQGAFKSGRCPFRAQQHVVNAERSEIGHISGTTGIGLKRRRARPEISRIPRQIQTAPGKLGNERWIELHAAHYRRKQIRLRTQCSEQYTLRRTDFEIAVGEAIASILEESGNRALAQMRATLTEEMEIEQGDSDDDRHQRARTDATATRCRRDDHGDQRQCRHQVTHVLHLHEQDQDRGNGHACQQAQARHPQRRHQGAEQTEPLETEAAVGALEEAAGIERRLIQHVPRQQPLVGAVGKVVYRHQR